MDSAEPAAALARSLIEVVAAEMGVSRGKWRLEFEFVDGRLERAFVHEGPIGATGLVRSARDA